MVRGNRTMMAAILGVLGFAPTLVDAFSGMALTMHRDSSTALFMSTITGGGAPILKSLLKKPSKVLTVGVEYLPPAVLGDDNLDVFSMKLRQQAKVSFVVCADLASIRMLANEQETAKGNFPGPLPLVYDCSDNQAGVDVEAVSKVGATAIVVDASDEDGAKALAKSSSSSDGSIETIWKVSGPEIAKSVLEWTEETADVFWLDTIETETAEKIVEVLPKSSTVIGIVDEPMQADGAEIQQGKNFKTLGCASVLVKMACVGDKEDIDYASFVVGGLTSKASSEFKFSGLTGSTNGHFGGIQSNSSVRWERVERKATTATTEEE